jgi:hypothetical protein
MADQFWTTFLTGSSARRDWFDFSLAHDFSLHTINHLQATNGATQTRSRTAEHPGRGTET